MVSSADEIITVIAFPERGSFEASQSENEAALVARWEAILARKDLTPQQRLTAEREYAKFVGSRQDIAEGNAKLFVDTAKEQASTITRGAIRSLFDEFLPLTLALIGLAAFAIFVRVYPGPK